MDDSAIDILGAVTGKSFSGFAEASLAILDVLEAELDGSALFVAHLDDEANTMRIIDTAGEGSFGLAAGRGVPLDQSFCVHMAADRSPRLINDAESDPNYAVAGLREPMDIKSYVGVPLELEGGDRVGSLCAISHERDQYTERDMKLLGVMSRLLANELEREARERTLKAVGDRLKELALTDQLTGLVNRRGFEEALKREWTLSRKRRVTDSILLISDVDGLKTVNDLLGHAEGDRRLQEVARALDSEARAPDIAARLGGDEFGVLLVGCPSLEEADKWTERVRRQIEGPATGEQERFGLSVGAVALWEAPSPEAAMEQADKRMYEDKRSRRGFADTAR